LEWVCRPPVWCRWLGSHGVQEDRPVKNFFIYYQVCFFLALFFLLFIFLTKSKISLEYQIILLLHHNHTIIRIMLEY
jgi:hypothetical protein